MVGDGVGDVGSVQGYVGNNIIIFLDKGIEVW